MISKLVIALGMVQAAISTIPNAEEEGDDVLLFDMDMEPAIRLHEKTESIPIPFNQVATVNDDAVKSEYSQRHSSLRNSQSGRTGTTPAILDNPQDAGECVKNPPRVLFYSPLPRPFVEDAFAAHCLHSIYVSNSLELSPEQVITLLGRLSGLKVSEDVFVGIRVVNFGSVFKAQMELWVNYALEGEEEEDRRVTELRNACEAIELDCRQFKFGNRYDISLYMYIHCDDIILLDHQ